VRNQGKSACDTIIVFSSLFALYLTQENQLIHKVKKSQQEKTHQAANIHQTKRQIHSRTCIFKVTNICQNHDPKSLQKLHKVL
jgi:Holliday junction resolvase-like predicted endonuclease